MRDGDAFREVRERCVKTFLDVIVASMLTERASWGYEIIANIHDQLRVLLSPGTIYRTLYSMERRGLIESVKSGMDSDRKFYSLTGGGAEWCKEMLKASRKAYSLIGFFELKRRKMKFEPLKNS